MRLNSEKVKTAMNKAGMTKDELVTVCGLQVCGIRTLKGEQAISPMRVKKIARVLGVAAREIVIEDYEGESQNEFK